MKVYQVARKSLSIFLSLTGLKVAEFDRLTTQFSHHIKFSKLGRHHNLEQIERAIFFILFYYRHYCIQELMAFIFRVDQSQISRWIKLLTLPFSRCTKQYIDKARKRIDSIEKLKEYVPDLDVIIDATERPLVSHTKYAKTLYSGKKKTYTVKNQVCVSRNTKEILHVSPTKPGARHDIYRLKESKDEIPPEWNLIVDLGYLGIEEVVPNRVFLPHKATKKFPLTEAERSQNRILSSQRCLGEHVFAHMKQYKILSDEFRGSATLCDASFQGLAGLYNFKRQNRKRKLR